MAYRLIFTDIQYLHSSDIRYLSLWISDIYIGWISTDTDIQYFDSRYFVKSYISVYWYANPSFKATDVILICSQISLSISQEPF